MKTINLRDILLKHWKKWYILVHGENGSEGDEDLFDETSNDYFIGAMREAVEQALELAAQNAYTDYDEETCNGEGVWVVKESITDTIKQVT
jgi:hypothetical protein